MTQTITNTDSVKKLSKFLVQKHLREGAEGLKFDFDEFGALRLYQATDKVLLAKCINDLLENKQSEASEEPVANTGNIILGQMNYFGAVEPQYHILTLSAGNTECTAVNKREVDASHINFSLNAEVEKYIGDNYWLVNGVCKDIAQDSECPNALGVAEIGAYITSFLIHDSLLPPSDVTVAAVELSGEKVGSDISE